MKSRRKRRKTLLTVINLSLLFSSLLALLALFFLLRQPEQSKENQSESASSQQVTKQEEKASSEQVSWTVQDQPVKIPILMYHAIHEMAPEEAANANLIVSPTTFESQIKRLVDEGYYFLSPEEAYRALTENSLPSSKVVWLTFDDSLLDFYTIAYPIMTKYKVKATNNVITGYTESGKAGHLSIDQIKEMAKNGMSFQSHTVNHPDLEMSAQETQENELSQSKSYLDTVLKQETTAIAYPAGRYSQTTLSLAEHSYKLGVTTNEGIASADDGLLSLKRIRILPNTDPDTLIASMTS